MRNGDRAHADLGAPGAHQRRDGTRRISGGVVSQRRAERAVAVEAGARVHVELGRAPRSERRRPFRADDAGGLDATVSRIDPVGDVVSRSVGAHAHGGLEPARPLHLVLTVDAEARHDRRGVVHGLEPHVAPRCGTAPPASHRRSGTARRTCSRRDARPSASAASERHARR